MDLKVLKLLGQKERLTELLNIQQLHKTGFYFK